jgi:tripartite-type tricarboxylate transporter receptor subunit TctC
MNLARRRFLHIAAGGAAFTTLSRIACAQTYPARQVRIIVGFAAGGPTDIAARLMCPWLSERLGQPFIVENRPGAGSNTATEVVVRSPPDGYSLLCVTVANAANATLYDDLRFNFIRDIAPVAGIMHVPNVLMVNPSVPAQTVPELIAYAKANRGKLNLATGGIGTSPHLCGELFRALADVDWVPVHYRGLAPALNDLLGGHVQVTFGSITSSVAYIRTGKVRALAVTSAVRSAALPDLPTVSDFLPGYEASAFYGLGTPKNTPTEIVDKLSTEVNACLFDLKIKERLAVLGCVPMPMTPAGFGKFIADETVKWGNVIRAANIKMQ